MRLLLSVFLDVLYFLNSSNFLSINAVIFPCKYISDFAASEEQLRDLTLKWEQKLLSRGGSAGQMTTVCHFLPNGPADCGNTAEVITSSKKRSREKKGGKVTSKKNVGEIAREKKKKDGKEEDSQILVLSTSSAVENGTTEIATSASADTKAFLVLTHAEQNNQACAEEDCQRTDDQHTVHTDSELADTLSDPFFMQEKIDLSWEDQSVVSMPSLGVQDDDTSAIFYNPL